MQTRCLRIPKVRLRRRGEEKFARERFCVKNTGEEKILARNSLFAAVSVYCAAITVTVVGELCPYTPFASAVTVICEPTPRPLILNVGAEV